MTRPPLAVALLCLLIAPFSADIGRAQTSDGAAYKVGVMSRHAFPSEPYDWRGSGSHALLETVWYPADNAAEAKPLLIGSADGPATFDAGTVAVGAKLAASPKTFPLILLSHGTGGTAQSIGWFAAALASRGFIVAGVNHPGNNAMEPYTVQGFTLWWKRAQDISAVLDDMLADSTFGPRIDRSRIGGAGISLGGYTMMELAGGVTSREHFNAFCRAATNRTTCKAPPEFADLVTKAKALAKSDPAYARALREAGRSYRDRRIGRVFAMAPALGPAFAPAGLKGIAIPVEIVAGESDNVAPIDANAKYYAAHIRHAELTIFPGGVGHYTFLDPCTDEGRASRPLLCVDNPGVDRIAVHNATIELAAKFFGKP